MDTYELLIKTNDYLIKGGTLTDKQTQNIVNQFLSSVSRKDIAERFYYSVKYPGNIDHEGRRLYPMYFIPPYNKGKKYRTLMTQTPKTHILSANSYELEIIRLLYLLAPDNKTVQDMVAQTLSRLKTTCFGNSDDGVGECYDTSLIVLRFLIAVAPEEASWIKERIENFHKYYDEKHRHWGIKWYFWLCLSELSPDIATPEIIKYQDELLKQINRSYVMNSEQDKTTHPMLICVVRNCLARLSEYEYLKGRLPYVREKDGRLYFDMAFTKSA